MHISNSVSRKNKKGMMLIEVLVSMFIFTIMIVSMISVFVTLIQKRSEVRDMQQQTEEFSLAMSYVAKKIRTSDLPSVSNCSSTSCTVHEHSTDADVTFTFSGGELKEGAAVLASNVTGGFVASSGSVPMVTIHMGNGALSVQTTVSLRSY